MIQFWWCSGTQSGYRDILKDFLLLRNIGGVGPYWPYVLFEYSWF